MSGVDEEGDREVGEARRLFEELREIHEEDKERVSFEWCEIIREAGNLFRDVGSIEKVAAVLGLSREETEEAIATYISIYTDDSSDILHGSEAGIRYYRDNAELPELAEYYGIESEDEAKDQVKGFVGGILRISSLSEIDLDPNIPDTPARTPPSEQLQQTLQSISSNINETIRGTLKPLQSIQFDVLQNTINQYQNIIKDLSSTISDLAERRREIADAIRDGINNFDEPQDYYPSEISVDSAAQSIGTTQLDRYISELKSAGDPTLENYVGRLDDALEEFEAGSHLLPIYVFISVQDGFLSYLCDKQNIAPGAKYYRKSHKEEAFKEAYPGFFGVDTADVVPVWSDFWDHRNAIMHGDPLAHFDHNIATISLLFLVLTIYSAFELETHSKR